MAKERKHFRCSECGEIFIKWQGRCDNCDSWNTMEEHTVSTASNSKYVRPGSIFSISRPGKPQALAEIKPLKSERLTLEVAELDNVFGGGIFPGSLNLIGGDPGIGKSTLMLQILNRLNGKCLYVTGEESAEQIKSRASRLNINTDRIFLLCENELEKVIEEIQKFEPDVLVIDSIQSIYSNQLASAPGNTSQIKECGTAFMNLSKVLGVTTFLIGHVTKEGGIAGPRLLEHMVDTVLFFENSENLELRLLRAYKNRFGSINEIGLFKMTDKGLVELKGRDWLFGNDQENLIGSSLSAIIEGSRAFTVELQSLVVPSHFGYPQRTASGIDGRKLSLLIAVYEKFLDHTLGNTDIFFKVAGGFQTKDPALDLALLVSLYSSFKNKGIGFKTAFLGEVGLAGEIRPVSNFQKRINELSKAGVKKVFGNFDGVKGASVTELISFKKVNKLFEQLSEK